MATNGFAGQNGSNVTVEEETTFEEFLGDWHHQQTRLLVELRAAQTELTSAAAAGDDVADNQPERDIDELISRVLIHLEEYFEQKSRVTKRDVFRFFDPTWCSAFESAFCWITGFRPCILLDSVTTSVPDLTPEQTEEVKRLKRELRKDERDLDDRLAIMHESIASPPISEMLKRGRHQDPGYFATVTEPLRLFRTTLEGLVEDADALRATIAARVVEILNPAQCLAFLIGALQLQQGMRNLKLQIRSMIRRREMEAEAQQQEQEQVQDNNE